MIDFLEVEDTVKDLKQQAETGAIDQETFNARLLALVDVSADGFYWMFGHKTEQWYRHNGKEWVADNPGELRVAMHHQNGPNTAISAKHQSSPPSPQPAGINWDSADANWFLIGLVVIGVVLTIIYSSAL